MLSGRWLAAVLITHFAVVEARAQYVYVPLGSGFSYPRWRWPGFYFGSSLPVPTFPPYFVANQRIVVVETPPTVWFRLPAIESEYDLRGVDLDLVPSKAIPPKPAEPRPKEVHVLPKPPRPEDMPPAPELPPRKDNPFDENARLIEIGLSAFRAEEYGLAARRFRQAIEVEPSVARSHFLLSQALFALGKYQLSAEAIEDGMRLQPKWPSAPFSPRVELYKEDTWQLHLGQLAEATKRQLNHPALLFLHAHQLWFGGQQAQAVVLFQKARPLAAESTFIDAFLKAAGAGAVAAK